MTNLEILDLCISNPEPLLDPYYMKNTVVIAESADCMNILMSANRALQDLITAYSVNLATGNTLANDPIIDRMIVFLSTQNINFSEFTSFWACCDVSYTVYCGLEDREKKNFLHAAVTAYIEKRHDLYQRHGYSFTTLQVQADSFAHKRSGQQGAQKARSILTSLGLDQLVGELPEEVDRHHFLICDRSNRHIFKRILDSLGIRLEWSTAETGKYPDYAVFVGNHTIITEHKHMKELGGGQDKQILEITEFLKHYDEHVSYVSFLDGILFAKLFNPDTRGKLRTQQTTIKDALSDYPNSFFVNTTGFKKCHEEQMLI